MVAGGVHCYVDLSETVAKKACAANVFTQIAHFPPWIGATFPLLWWSSQPPTPLLAHRALYLVQSSKEETLGCCTLYRWSGNIWFIYWDISKFFNLCKDIKVSETQTFPTKNSNCPAIASCSFCAINFSHVARKNNSTRSCAERRLLFGWLPSPAPAPASISDQPSLHTKDHSQQKKIILNKRRSFSTKENHFEQKRIILNKRRSCSTKKNSPAKTIDQSHYRYPDRCHHYFQQTPLSHGSRTHCNLFPHLIQPTPQLANSASHCVHFSM